MARKDSKSRYSSPPPQREASKTQDKKQPTAVKSPVASAPAAAAPAVIEANANVATLIQSLRDSDADVARDAAIALGQQGDRSAVESLIDVLDNASGYFHPVVRAAAAASLGQLRDPRAAASLRSAVRDPMAEISAEAVRALADLGQNETVDVLAEVVHNSKGYFLPIVRRAAVLALAKIASEKARALLAHVASNPSEDPVIRQTAQQA